MSTDRDAENTAAMMSPEAAHRRIKTALDGVLSAFLPHRPKAMLLFGSAAAYLDTAGSAPAPNDVDVLVVGDLLMAACDTEAFPIPVEIHRFRTEEMLSVARTLRYFPKPIALPRLYGKAVVQQHSRNIIAACLLLGPTYRDFGIEQIDIDGIEDTRDYSRHRILHGHDWWCRLQTFARERRTVIEHLADRIVGADQFR